jgi:hypothetical protein
MVQSFSVDYMHSVLLGVVRHFPMLWVGRGRNYSLTPIQVQCIDSKLRAIKPPVDVTRLPVRSITQASKWKANECRAWLLHYSVFVLRGVLSSNLVSHWALLAKAVYLLLKTSISVDDVSMARNLLQTFVKQVELLYGKEHMSYNVHQLLHLPDCVLACGPLWRSSAFPFESHNTKLLKLFHGYTHVSAQIANNFETLHNVTKLIESAQNEAVSELSRTWLSGYPLLHRVVSIDKNVKLLGTGISRTLSEEEAANCGILEQASAHVNYESYKRALIRGKLFYTESYNVSVQPKRSNSFVLLNDQTVVALQDFMHMHTNACNSFFVKCEKLARIICPLDSIDVSQYVTVKRTGQFIIIPPSFVVSKCVVLQTTDTRLTLSLQPNVIECD